jgi:hypothetical protein
MEEGILLTLQIQVAPGTPSIQIEMARVRWVNNNECGIEFLLLYEGERKALQRFLRTVAVQFIH